MSLTTKTAPKPVQPPKKQQKAQPKASKDITNGVANLAVQETPKVKSKNIDVIAEYNKIKQKNAANFVGRNFVKRRQNELQAL